MLVRHWASNLSNSAMIAALVLAPVVAAAGDTGMNDQIAISDSITRMLNAIDALDWTGVRGEFADTVDVDYTSLAGGQPATIAADQLMTTWQGLLPGFEATQHLTGPIRAEVAGSVGTAYTSVRGYHYIKGAPGGEVWMVAGTYTMRMVRQAGA